jgi:hypothetical protein
MRRHRLTPEQKPETLCQRARRQNLQLVPLDDDLERFDLRTATGATFEAGLSLPAVERCLARGQQSRWRRLFDRLIILAAFATTLVIAWSAQRAARRDGASSRSVNKDR